MKEQSHKDEMSAALRGDFERLRGRGVATTLSPVEPSSESDPPPHVEAEADVGAAAAEPEPEPERPSFLGRLLGR